MTPRERVVAAFEHREPDRTPIFEKLIKSPIADELLGRPCAASNLDYQMQRLADGDWEGLQKQSARDLVDLSKMLGFDIVRLPRNGGRPPLEQRPRRLAPGVWEVGSMVAEVLDKGWVRWRPVEPEPRRSEAEQEAALRQSLEAEPGEPVLHDSTFLVIREGRRIIEQEGLDLAVFSEVYAIGAATLPAFVFCWFATEPDLLHRYYRRSHVPAMATLRRLVQEGVDIVALGGDLACDLGPMVSPAHYREFIMPYIRQQAELCHSLGAYCTNATDGDIWPILDDFILGTGVDGYEEIDFAAGMDLPRLKAKYGERCVFVGNVDIRHTLTSGTVDQVRAHTVACIKAGWGNGGHVLMSGNCIHEDCKTHLFLAHLQAYRDYFGLR